jgi:hypothetical protein
MLLVICPCCVCPSLCILEHPASRFRTPGCVPQTCVCRGGVCAWVEVDLMEHPFADDIRNFIGNRIPCITLFVTTGILALGSPKTFSQHAVSADESPTSWEATLGKGEEVHCMFSDEVRISNSLMKLLYRWRYRSIRFCRFG